MVIEIYQKLAVAERRACKVLGQARATQRYATSPPCAESRLTEDIIALATKYGRYGYRRITALLRNEKGRGVPEHLRSDNGPEFTAKAVRAWLIRIGVKTLFIERGAILTMATT